MSTNSKAGGKGEALSAGTGAVVGASGAVAGVAAAGTVTGLGATGITSGLAAIGAALGGGMATGLVIVAAAPIATAGVGYGVYKLYQRFKR